MMLLTIVMILALEGWIEWRIYAARRDIARVLGVMAEKHNCVLQKVKDLESRIEPLEESKRKLRRKELFYNPHLGYSVGPDGERME